MNVKYCSSCGKKTEYSITPPKLCAACNKPFADAFLNKNTPNAKTLIKPIIASNRSNRYRPTSNRPINEDGQDDNQTDSIDKQEVQSMADDILQSLGSECGIIIPPKQSYGYKLSDVLDPNKNIEIGSREEINPSI